MNLKAHLKNVRLIDELSSEFKSGNLYVVRAKNERGKTTFKNALRGLITGNLPNDMLTRGEEEGVIEGTFTTADNKLVKVIINLKEGKDPSFKIVDSDLNTSTRKGDLADKFDYSPVDLETFLGWGLTKPGREKQAKVLINILPQDVQAKIEEIGELLSEKDNGKSIFIQRRDVGIVKKNLAVVPELTEKESELLKMCGEKKWKDRTIKEKEDYDVLIAEKNRIEGEQKVWDTKKETYGENYISDKEQAVKDAEKALEKAKQELREAKENVAGLGKRPELPEVDYDKKKSDLETAQQMIAKVEAIEEKLEEHKLSVAKKEELDKKYNEFTQQIEEKRKERQKLIQDNLSVQDVTIDDGELKLIQNGEMFEFTEESLSFSTAAKKFLEIMLLLNPTCPIFTLGKAAEFDLDTLRYMSDFAEKNDCTIILDYVDPMKDKLVIECWEE